MPRKFNPPPGWPPPPPGWSPGPSWQPDPSWPLPPDGWPLWIDEPPAIRLAWYGPGSMMPTPPRAVSRAVRLILAGAALAVVYGVVDGMTSHNSVFYISTSTPSGTTVHQANSLVSGILTGVVQSLLWLWMAWKSNAGRNWARVLSSVFFGLMSLGLVGAIAGAASHGESVPALLVTLIEWGAGLAALILLWRPESSQFFAAARQAKLTTASFPPHPGAAHPAGGHGQGYPLSPQHGQPPEPGQSRQNGDLEQPPQ